MRVIIAAMGVLLDAVRVLIEFMREQVKAVEPFSR